jgi:anti-anti-sigma factor
VSDVLDDGQVGHIQLGGENVIPFDVRATACDGLATVMVRGDLDCATAPSLGATLEGLAAADQVVVVDLGDTEFMDCAGVGVLIGAHQRQRRLGGDLIIESPSAPVARVLELTGVIEVITVAASDG